MQAYASLDVLWVVCKNGRKNMVTYSRGSASKSLNENLWRELAAGSYRIQSCRLWETSKNKRQNITSTPRSPVKLPAYESLYSWLRWLNRSVELCLFLAKLRQRAGSMTKYITTHEMDIRQRHQVLKTFAWSFRNLEQLGPVYERRSHDNIDKNHLSVGAETPWPHGLLGFACDKLVEPSGDAIKIMVFQLYSVVPKDKNSTYIQEGIKPQVGQPVNIKFKAPLQCWCATTNATRMSLNYYWCDGNVFELSLMQLTCRHTTAKKTESWEVRALPQRR